MIWPEGRTPQHGRDWSQPYLGARARPRRSTFGRARGYRKGGVAAGVTGRENTGASAATPRPSATVPTPRCGRVSHPVLATGRACGGGAQRARNAGPVGDGPPGHRRWWKGALRRLIAQRRHAPRRAVRTRFERTTAFLRTSSKRLFEQVRELAHDPAAKSQHAGDENQSLHDRHPMTEPSEIVLQRDDDRSP